MCSMVDPTLSECIRLLQECEQRMLQSGGHVDFWWLSQRVHDQVISAVSTWGGLHHCDAVWSPFCLRDMLMGLVSKDTIDRYDTLFCVD